MALKVKNWSKFQHYKGRRPPWIKLHRDMLEDRAFLSLPLASQALAPRLWLLASESEDGSLTSDCSDLAFRMRCSEADLLAAVKPLIDAKFLSGALDVASGALAECERVAILEKNRVEENRVETEKKPLSESRTASPPLQWPDPIDETVSEILANWSERTGTKLRAEGAIRAARKRVRARLKDGCTPEQLAMCVEFALADAFYLSKGYAKQPSVFWKNAERVAELQTRVPENGTRARGKPATEINDATIEAFVQRVEAGK